MIRITAIPGLRVLIGRATNRVGRRVLPITIKTSRSVAVLLAPYDTPHSRTPYSRTLFADVETTVVTDVEITVVTDLDTTVVTDTADK